MDNKIQSECRKEAYDGVNLTAMEQRVLSHWGGKYGLLLCCYDISYGDNGLDQLSIRPRLTCLAQRGWLKAVKKATHPASGGRNVTYYMLGDGPPPVWPADPVPSKHEQIDKIMGAFDWNRVRTVMNALNWEWGTPGFLPTVFEMQLRVKMLFNEIQGRCGSSSSGGFCASKDSDGIYALQFIVEQRDGE